MDTLRGAMWIVVAGAAIGLAANALRADGLALLRPVRAEAAETAEACVAPEAQARVGVDQALELRKRGVAVFADVRPAAEYANGHVSDAVHLECRSTAPAWLDRIGRQKTLVLYDGGGADADSVAHALAQRGSLIDVRVLAGGFPAWRAAGAPSEAGRCEACE
ncbi:MAG: rhodanese-like domain-containing protein [Myxococcota bacterium]